jgi:hypothetical protein
VVQVFRLEDRWPFDLRISLEMAPEDLTEGTGAEWLSKQKNRKKLEVQGNEQPAHACTFRVQL